MRNFCFILFMAIFGYACSAIPSATLDTRGLGESPLGQKISIYDGLLRDHTYTEILTEWAQDWCLERKFTEWKQCARAIGMDCSPPEEDSSVCSYQGVIRSHYGPRKKVEDPEIIKLIKVTATPVDGNIFLEYRAELKRP